MPDLNKSCRELVVMSPPEFPSKGPGDLLFEVVQFSKLIPFTLMIFSSKIAWPQLVYITSLPSSFFKTIAAVISAIVSPNSLLLPLIPKTPLATLAYTRGSDRSRDRRKRSFGA